MLTIPSTKTVYSMSPLNPPAAAAESGDTVRFITLDCFGGQITDESQHMNGINWSQINPATGPLYVNGAEPGDTLRIEIEQIKLAPSSVTAEAPGEGLTGKGISEEATRIFPVSGGKLHFNERLSLDICPMIGVIGTAPQGEPVETGTPGSHGGNMDCTRIGEGTVLYLPVNVPGALLAMGDIHAVMGDGEVCVCGAETAAEITVNVSVIKDRPLPLPFLADSSHVMTIYSADTLDLAAEGATLAMRGYLTSLGMDIHDAGMLMSLNGDLRICQAVDPQKTCRMELPLNIIQLLGGKIY